MKITCNSCGSKYTIADAKVAGKKVKVRCKGCKESILVDGTAIGSPGSGAAIDENDDGDADGAGSSLGADEPMTSATDEERKKDLWSVNISDDDSRDMTLEELIAGWRNGTVTSDAYVWKDGMGDWKPILEVGELKLKLGAAPKKGGVVSSASAAAVGGMDDLFGGMDTAANHPGELEKPARPAPGGKPTGARNDSSVLFSLDSLNAADAPTAQVSNNTADALFAGLNTNIGSLTGNADLLTAPAKEPPPAPAGNRAQPILAAAPPAKSKTGLIAAIIGAALIIGGAVFFMGGDKETEADAPKEDAAALAAKAEAEKLAAKELAEKEAKLKAMEEELKKAKEEAKKPDPAEEEAKKKEEELKKEKEEAEKKAAEEAAKKSDSGAAASGTSTSTKPATSGTPASSGGGAKFDVGAAKAALQAAAANAAACAKPGGPTGAGKVQVTFSTSGRVTSATVISGPFGGTAVGGCVASTFRRARVPAFSGNPQTVAKSFTIN